MASVYAVRLDYGFEKVNWSTPDLLQIKAHHLLFEMHALEHTVLRIFALDLRLSDSELEKLLDYPQCLFRILDSMPNRPLVVVDLPVVASRKGFVTEEVDILVVNARQTLGSILLSFDVL